MNSFLKSTFLKIFRIFEVKKPNIMKNLAVFDFDHTIIDDNSDTAIMKLVNKSKYPPELKELHKSEGWTCFMQGVFDVLHENNITEADIAMLIKKLPEVEGIKSLITELHDNMDYDVIVISDSNTFFIDMWLKANQLSGKVLKVFSNPAEFDENGRLSIKMYHNQDSCILSTRNLCKGMILDDFIEQQNQRGIFYKKVVYIGDGHNDFCPILRLNEKGVACCREKYKCVDLVRRVRNGKKISESDQTEYVVKADVCVWQNGQNILDFLRK
ncbi:pyridoxal phosphate phosphatase PHOSPHO2-like [Anthonomus grandis grandis]|uniref:pyridoxal phosphate phosphatase PHOSPHO2-like n=1 Tax=Anthonomus grandis grandis TaxID=2921223 RepID=UPI0021657A0D|nr:pyridoxal phosphate phosphatase PHOSPHO2-like [Anthonomus grandis grandis]